MDIIICHTNIQKLYIFQRSVFVCLGYFPSKY